MNLFRNHPTSTWARLLHAHQQKERFSPDLNWVFAKYSESEFNEFEPRLKSPRTNQSEKHSVSLIWNQTKGTVLSSYKHF